MDSGYYKSNTKKIRKGKDKNGNYNLMELNYEVPCNCHPETCNCGGKSWVKKRYKKYENGNIIDVKLHS